MIVVIAILGTVALSLAAIVIIVRSRNRALGTKLRSSEEILHLMLEGMQDCAVYMLDPHGNVASWNENAARLKGYEASEILGRNFTCFFTVADLQISAPQKALEAAIQSGRYESQGWRVRKDGSTFWANCVISPLYDEKRTLRGFCKILRDITERREVEGRLHESEDQLGAVVRSAMDAILSVDQMLNVVLFNAAAEKMFGVTAAEALGQPLDRFLPPRFRAAHAGHIQSFSKTGDTDRAMGALGALWGLRSNGEEFPIEASISQMEFGGKKVFTAIVRDLTERERAQEASRNQARLLDLSQVFLREMDGRIVIWTEASARLFGFSKEETVGRFSHELFHTVFPGPLEQIEEKVQRTGRWEGELVHTRRDGNRIVVFSVWVLDRDAGGRRRILEAHTDITAHKNGEMERARQAEELSRIEKALRAQTGILNSVLDNMEEGLIAADQNGRFVLWNPAAENILGRTAADVSLTEWSTHYGVYQPDGVTPFPAGELPLVRALRGQAALVEMVVDNPRMGEKVWIEASARPLKDENGVLSGGVVAFRNISKRKRDEILIRKLNDELEQRVIERTAQLEGANKELEAFTYSVSHDLRAPLRHIAGFSSMLIEELAPTLNTRCKQSFQRIQDGTRKMGQMIDELLDLARMGRRAADLQGTSLTSIVTEVLALLKENCAGRQVEWKIGALPFVDCDPTLIKMVFQNLISNALKYSRPRSPAVIEVACEQQGGESVIFVRDNGVGFSMKYADKLFGVFQRLHRVEDFEGTGVGLATVQRIIHKHGGRIWAEAELDRGATFYFTIGTHARPSEALLPVGQMQETRSSY